MIEVMSARKYYGSHGVGSVLLVNGQPYHYTAPTMPTQRVSKRSVWRS